MTVFLYKWKSIKIEDAIEGWEGGVTIESWRGDPSRWRVAALSDNEFLTLKLYTPCTASYGIDFECQENKFSKFHLGRY